MKLRYRLLLRTIAAAALIFGAFGAVLIQSSFHLQLNREKEALELRSASLAQSIEAAAVNYTLQSITVTDELLTEILARLDDAAVLVCAPTEGEAGDIMYLSGGVLTARRAVSVSGRICHFTASADLGALQRTQQSLLLVYSFLYLVMLLVFSSFMTLTAKSLSQPIERLADISQRLAEGELTVRAQPDSMYETEKLARSFNRMADALTGQIDRQQRFIADLTHEMKTPLTAMIGHADLIRSGCIAGEDAQLAAQSIFKEGRRLSALSSRMIDLILLENEQFEMTPTHIRPLIEDAAASMRIAAETSGAELTTRLEDAVFSCEPALFSSLIINLTDNAIKSGASKIMLDGQLTSGTYILRVTDDGRGMDAATLSRITEPFFRADKSRSRAQGGAGLGLALCARIAELHHSALSFESTPGKGTCAMLRIPGKEAEPNEEA